MSKISVLVVDGQGGGIGGSIVRQLNKRTANILITAVGTNAIATSAMLSAGAHRGASGENAAVCNCKSADIIAGPIGIIIANSMLGEISPLIARAVSESDAKKVLIPINKCSTYIAGSAGMNLDEYIEDAVSRILEIVNTNNGN